MFFGKKRRISSYLKKKRGDLTPFDGILADYVSGELKGRLADLGLRKTEISVDWFHGFRCVGIQGRYEDFFVSVQADEEEIALGIRKDEPDYDEVYQYGRVQDAGGFFALLKDRLLFYKDGLVSPAVEGPSPQGPELMAEFFSARAEGYDSHMLLEVEGCAEGYLQMASLVPAQTELLLDLGCGTGLELDEIFKRFPDLSVVGVDLSRPMMDRLKQKHPDKDLCLICGDYFTAEFGGEFDCAVSFETLHHFTPDQKTGLYRKIFEALTDEGVYIECDYMVDSPEEEERYFAEYARLTQDLPEGYYHYDTPCTVERQIRMLKTAGFLSVEQGFRRGGTCMLIAKKGTFV